MKCSKCKKNEAIVTNSANNEKLCKECFKKKLNLPERLFAK